MEIRLLKYFLAVAEEESITQAANLLHVTQPTLSRQLRDLEAETGVRLFHRGTRRITLTPEGILLRRRAAEILSLVGKTEQELATSDKEIAGRIAIGCGELEAVRTLTQLIAAFGERYPQVDFEIFTADSDTLQERMDQGILDLALLLEPVDVAKYSYVRLPQRERWAAVLPADSPLAAKEAITVADFVGNTIILPRRAKVQRELANWFGAAWGQMRTRYTSNLSTNASIMVRQHLGIAVVLEGSLPFVDEKEIHVRPLTPELATTTVLAWKSQQPFGRAATKFIECLEDMLRETTTDAGK